MLGTSVNNKIHFLHRNFNTIIQTIAMGQNTV